ncbi:MAG: hypothetical protein JWR59_768 [Brevundimonas sp.]|nr:hypothetical protein [Brevundimonas sp.]
MAPFEGEAADIELPDGALPDGALPDGALSEGASGVACIAVSAAGSWAGLLQAARARAAPAAISRAVFMGGLH